MLLTGPHERLHRPDFGGGLGPATIFEPLHEGLAAIVELRVRGSLEDALGDRIECSVDVERVGESELDAAVSYRLRPDGEPTTLGVPIRA